MLFTLIFLALLFIPLKADPTSFEWKNGTFYALTPDCSFVSAISVLDIQTKMNQQISNDRSCENIASVVHQNSKGNHLIVIKYESAKEISILVKQINDLTDISFNALFVKVNYEYMLGDYCSFDKSLLSIGVDSSMVYTTVKCGEETWAFMRSVLTPDGTFYTPAGPLIYFKKGDPSFDRLLFVSTYDGDNNSVTSLDDAVVLRYTIKENTASGSKMIYFATLLHELNKTENSISSIQNVGSSKNIYFSTALVKIVVAGASNNKAEVKFFVLKSSLFSNISALMDSYVEGFGNGDNAKTIVNKDPSFIRAFGFFLDIETNQPSKATSWKIRDTKRISSNYISEDCPVEYEKKEKEHEKCEGKTQSKKLPYVFVALYFTAGAELLLLIGTLAALIGITVRANKKSKKNRNNVIDEANVNFLAHNSAKRD